MKRIICVLMVLITVLTACSNDNLPADSSLNEVQAELLPGGISPDDYDTVEEYDVFYILSNQTGKMRPTIMESNQPTAYLAEIAETEVWFLSKSGEILNEEPYEYYEEMVNYIAGFRNGSFDAYEITESGIEFSNSSEPQKKEAFGYTVFSYNWFIQSTHYGIIAPDGSVFAEPVYCYAAVPFADRIVLQSGSNDSFGGRSCRILDENGEVINESFNCVFYYFLADSDEYIGAAFSADPEDIDTTVICKDESGTPIAHGWYFVDKDGNIIDGPFKELTVNENYLESVIPSPDSEIKITYHSGEEKVIKAKEILIEY
ncbi:MAG: hypothetical protein IJ306_04750 [Oscillospiraceae bacterium]|nr:hypothetical protein [Oscillospiraceae bacterium]